MHASLFEVGAVTPAEFCEGGVGWTVQRTRSVNKEKSVMERRFVAVVHRSINCPLVDDVGQL
jgi:hypothetical protein